MPTSIPTTNITRPAKKHNPIKGKNKTPETNAKEMQICELSDKEFKITVIKMPKLKKEYRHKTK